MVNFSILISNSEVSGPGGLFDIDATLPLVAIQFVILAVVLNVILFSPLLAIIEERKEYVLNKLAKASEMLSEANELIAQYEQSLNSAREKAQLEITLTQEFLKNLFAYEQEISEEYLDEFLVRAEENISCKRDMALTTLDSVVTSLCNEIENRLSI